MPCALSEGHDIKISMRCMNPKEVINRLTVQIAREEDLPADWLNDSVKGFVSADAPVEDFMSLDGLRITTVSPEYLLAMKLMSARFGEYVIEECI